MRILALILVATIALAVVACSTGGTGGTGGTSGTAGTAGTAVAGTAPTAGPFLVPEFTDAGAPIEVVAGQSFTISVDANPSTGFRWDLSEQLNGRLLRAAGDEFVPRQQPGGAAVVGAGGRQVLKFKAIDKGTTLIVLKYARPGDKTTAPASGPLS